MKKITRLSDEKTKIVVNNSGIVEMQYFDDYPDGNIVIGEYKKHIPFSIKRIYFINDLYRLGAIRGKHAHKKLKQVIFCVNGSFDLFLDDGKNKQTILMDTSYKGIILGPLLWHEMTNFTNDCVILVLASDYYKEKDYLRQYEDFTKKVN